MHRESEFRKFLNGMAYLFPALAILIVFQIYPIGKALMMSFYTKYNYFKHIVFEYGFDNYINLFNDDKFIIALKNTFIFVLGVVPASLVLSVFIAVLLNSNIRFKNLFRNIYFLPFVTSTVALSIIWRWIFNGDYGLANYMVLLLGGKR